MSSIKWMRSMAFLLTGLPCVGWAQLQWAQQAVAVETTLGQRHLEVEFPFQNVGSEPIAIVSVRHSCGCTTGALSKDVYAPGEGDRLSVKMNLDGLHGPQSKTVSVYTSDRPDTPSILTIETTIPQRFDIVPGILGWTFRGEAGLKRTRLHIHKNLDIPLEAIELRINDRDGKGLQFKAAVKMGAAPHSYVIEVLPVRFPQTGHSYLEVYYKHAEGVEKVGEVYLVVH